MIFNFLLERIEVICNVLLPSIKGNVNTSCASSISIKTSQLKVVVSALSSISK